MRTAAFDPDRAFANWLFSTVSTNSEENEPSATNPAHINAFERTGRLIRLAASENGATLVGDEWSGRFSHESLKGEYRMVGQKVVVTVTDKHWLLPWPVVEVRLRELLASA